MKLSTYAARLTEVLECRRTVNPFHYLNATASITAASNYLLDHGAPHTAPGKQQKAALKRVFLFFYRLPF